MMVVRPDSNPKAGMGEAARMIHCLSLQSTRGRELGAENSIPGSSTRLTRERRVHHPLSGADEYPSDVS